MTSYKKLLLIFLIPFVLSVGLALLGNYLFPPVCTSSAEIKGKLVCFDQLYDDSWTREFYGFLIICLFIVSVILPPLITWREYQSQKTERKLKSLVVNGNN